MTERPLITFVVFAYNQERFIREAVEGALSQSYSPLEILLSDDCSTDQTFEIMKDAVAYYHGPHKILLSQNPTNLGVGEHINRIMDLANGDLIVAAAGDDISMPQRAQVVVEEWLRQGRKPTSIHSDYAVINENGLLIEDKRLKSSFAGPRSQGISDIQSFLKGRHPANRMLGATHAWSKHLFENMPYLNSNVFFEDRVIAFRSLVMGEFAYIPQKLVYYRMHSGNLTARLYNDDSMIIRLKKSLLLESENCFRHIAVLENYRKDVSVYMDQGILTQQEGDILLKDIDRLQNLKRREVKIFSGPPLLIFGWFLWRLIFYSERSHILNVTKSFLKKVIVKD